MSLLHAAGFVWAVSSKQVAHGVAEGFDYLSLANLVGSILLPLVGIGVVAVSLLAFFLPYGTALKDHTQRVKAFGVDLEVSAIMLFVLVGLMLSLTGIYLRSQDYERRIQGKDTEVSTLASKVETLREEVSRAKRVDVSALITLENEDGIPPEQLQCNLLLFGGSDRKLPAVRGGVKKGQYRLEIQSISQDRVIQALQCTDSSKGRRWALDKIDPLSPEYILRIAP